MPALERHAHDLALVVTVGGLAAARRLRASLYPTKTPSTRRDNLIYALVGAAQVLGHGELALERLGLDLGLRRPFADAAELAEEEAARRALLAVRLGFGRRRAAGVPRRGLGVLVRGIGGVRVADEGREPRGLVVGDVRRGHCLCCMMSMMRISICAR